MGLRPFKATAKVAFVTRIEGDQWRLVAVELNGDRVAEIDKAQITQVVDDLDAEGAIEFALPVDDAKAANLPPMREVQVWKGDSLLKWGPVFRPQANSRSLQFTGAGLEWYFLRRHFGKADRTNYIDNGDFEAGMAHWRPAFAYYSNAQAPPANSIVSFPTMTGRRALQLTGAADDHDTFADQGFPWVVDESLSPEGDRFTVVGYVYVSSYLGPAIEYRGLMLERFSTTEPHPDPVLAALGYKASMEHVFARIDEDTPTGQWVKLEASLTTPPKAGEPEGVRVTLYPPHGTATFDRISLVLDEATRFYGIDQAQIAEGIVEHLQDPDYDKTDLLIGTNCQPTGVLRDRIYLHAEHENGKGALDDLTQMDDGIDYSVEITPTTRTFTTHYPRKGVDHLGLVLEYGRNVEDFNWAFDGAVASNQVISLGSGDGSAREEGVATDLTALEGVSLEEVYVATEGADISSLDNRAAARLEVIKNPIILELFFKNTTLAGSPPDRRPGPCPHRPGLRPGRRHVPGHPDRDQPRRRQDVRRGEPLLRRRGGLTNARGTHPSRHPGHHPVHPDRLDRLERRLANLARLRFVVDVPFTLVDVSVSTSPAYYFAVPGAQVFEVVVSLGTPPGPRPRVTVSKNGNVIATITLDAGQTVKVTKVTADFTGNQDRLNVSVTAAGTEPSASTSRSGPRSPTSRLARLWADDIVVDRHGRRDDIPSEPHDAGDHDVPGDLVELHEVLEWDAAVTEDDRPEGDRDHAPPLPRPDLGLRPHARLPLDHPRGPDRPLRGDSPWGGADRSSDRRLPRHDHPCAMPSICRAWQAFHMDDRGWSDIAYNSGVCPHGVRFEGRGARVRSGANGTERREPPELRDGLHRRGPRPDHRRGEASPSSTRPPGSGSASDGTTPTGSPRPARAIRSANGRPTVGSAQARPNPAGPAGPGPTAGPPHRLATRPPAGPVVPARPLPPAALHARPTRT